MNKRKLLMKILSGSKNVQFSDLILLVEAFGFSLARINGSHYIFTHPNVSEIVNLQGKMARQNHTRCASFCSL